MVTPALKQTLVQPPPQAAQDLPIPGRPSPAALSHASRLATWAGITVAGTGTLVLCGWIFGIDALKTIYGPITMKTNAAIALLLCGVALWSTQHRRRTLGIVCAACAILIAAATLTEHLTGRDLGIDQLLFSEAPGAIATSSPNRMGLNASSSVILIGIAIILLLRATPRAIRGAQVLALVCATAATLAMGSGVISERVMTPDSL